MATNGVIDTRTSKGSALTHNEMDTNLTQLDDQSRNALSGCVITVNSTDSDHDIDIAAGIARDATNAAYINLTSAITKQIDSAWAAGTNMGGFAASGSITADTVYYVFLIMDSSGTIDAGFDDSLTATNLLSASGYTYYRRIGFVATDGSSNIHHFVWYGNWCRYTKNSGEFSVTLTTTNTSTQTLSRAPANMYAEVSIKADHTNQNNVQEVFLRHTGWDNSNTAAPWAVVVLGKVASGASAEQDVQRSMVGVDGSQQVAIRLGDAHSTDIVGQVTAVYDPRED